MREKKNDWRDWLADVLNIRPDDRGELMDLLQKLQQERHFLSAREMLMIEGVLRIREWKVRDVMIAINDAVSMRIDDDYARAVATVREWQHSRYPVFDKNNESVLGILLAKDLLGYTDRPAEFQMADVMRKAVFESVSKSLDTLLEDFRTQRSHMVIAVDEYSQTAGIVTIEDLLERIVGEIEDESDEEDDRVVVELPNDAYAVKATMSVEEFNAQFKAALPTGNADNIAGWLAAELGGMPKKGDQFQKHGFTFKVVKADERRVYMLEIAPDNSD